MVGVVGFEPTTPCSQSRCANRTALHPDGRWEDKPPARIGVFPEKVCPEPCRRSHGSDHRREGERRFPSRGVPASRTRGIRPILVDLLSQGGGCAAGSRREILT